ncbi:MAG: hypothetical protein FWD19_02660 [Defluviitaleaceae bacterium]|nr:hypothetical protein [Defluviitaleaceae bacterium]
MDDKKNKNDIDDLEAQLASLGIYGENDDAPDPFANFDFSDEEDPFAALEALSQPAPPQPAPKPAVTLDDLDLLDELNKKEPAQKSDSSEDFDDLAELGYDFEEFEDDSEPQPMTADADEMDFDRQLEMLLAADKSADNAFEVKDIASIMPTQTVYDPEVDGMGTVHYVKGSFVKDSEKKEKLFANISFPKMIATFAIGFIIIVTGAATAITAISTVYAKKTYVSELNRQFTPVEIPVGVSNNTNFIFVNERASINAQPFTLSRISAAYSGTFFYFEENFVPDDFYILLFDQARNLFSQTTFNISAQEEGGTVLRFEQLLPETLFLTLHLQCKKTNETARWQYRLESPPAHETPVFFTEATTVLDSSPLVISHAVFDNASSTIHFNYRPPQQREGYRISDFIDVPKVAIYEQHTAVTPFTNEDAFVSFAKFNMLVGAATFGPILNLDNRIIDIVFYGLTYFYTNPIFDVTPEKLFANNQDNPIPVQTGDFTLMLEGMKQEASLIILTLHGLDENKRRRATNLGITLRVDIGENNFVEMPGTVHVNPEGLGSDVLFDMRPHGATLREPHISQYSFVVDWVEYDVPSAKVEFNVRRFFNQPSYRRYAPEAAVTEAFLSLLAQKSGEISSDGLVGLSPELKNPLGLFAPTKFEGRAMYSASVTTGELVTNYDYAAIVEVTWAAEENTNLKFFRETFKVTARSSDNIWTITEIETV